MYNVTIKKFVFKKLGVLSDCSQLSQPIACFPTPLALQAVHVILLQVCFWFCLGVRYLCLYICCSKCVCVWTPNVYWYLGGILPYNYTMVVHVHDSSCNTLNTLGCSVFGWMYPNVLAGIRRGFALVHGVDQTKSTLLPCIEL